MNRTVLVAWDIETAPFDLETMSPPQRGRYEKELARQVRQDPALDPEEASRLVRSTHPQLGWICSISAVSGTVERGHNTPCSWSAADPDAEAAMIAGFWEAVRDFPAGRTVWITFNGKRFDAPFLLARSAHHRIEPTRFDLLDSYPYRHVPHADLSYLWPYRESLEELCDFFGVASPKQVMNGHDVALAVAGGQLDDVAAYCERDVVATFECFQAVPYILTM